MNKLGMIAAIGMALGGRVIPSAGPFRAGELARDRGAIIRRLKEFYARRPRPWRQHPSAKLGRAARRRRAFELRGHTFRSEVR